MAVITWLLSLYATACALGWICGVRWCDVGFFAVVGVALLVEPARQP